MKHRLALWLLLLPTIAAAAAQPIEFLGFASTLWLAALFGSMGGVLLTNPPAAASTPLGYVKHVTSTLFLVVVSLGFGIYWGWGVYIVADKWGWTTGVPREVWTFASAGLWQWAPPRALALYREWRLPKLTGGQ
jgi:hypothetical protein